MKIKACKDCKWCDAQIYDWGNIINCAEPLIINYVRAFLNDLAFYQGELKEPQTVYPITVYSARSNPMLCGIEAKRFKPKISVNIR